MFNIRIFLLIALAGLSLVAPAAHADHHKAESMGINLVKPTYYYPQYAFNDLLYYQHNSSNVTKRSDRHFETILAMDNLMWFPTVTIKADAPLKKVSMNGTVIDHWVNDREVVLRVTKQPSKYNAARLGNHVFLRVDWDPMQPVTKLQALTDAEHPEALFNSSFLDMLRPMPVLRMMDWGMTNGSRLHEWSDRSTPYTPFQTLRPVGKSGVPIEYMVDLCNEVDADIWYCVPHDANDDFVRRAAELIKERLKPELRVYIEYSNEVWNGIFSQNRYAAEKGRAILPNSPDWARALGYYGYRSEQIHNIFKGILEDRCTTVLAGQLDNVGTFTHALKQYKGKPDTVSGALYFQGGFSPSAELDRDIAKSGAAAFLPKTRQSVERTIRHLEAFKRMAEDVGAEMIAYEGGQHLTSKTNNWPQTAERAYIDFQTGPHMLELYQDLWHAAEEAGFTLVMWYADCFVVSPEQSWGHRLNPVTPHATWQIFTEAMPVGSEHEIH